MKLLIKTTLYYVIASLLFFIAAGFIIVYDFNNILDQEINNLLINSEEIVTTQIVNDIPLESLNNYEQVIEKTNSKAFLDKPCFKDTTRYDIIDDNFHKYRMLRVTRRIGNNYYDISIFRSLIQPNTLVKQVLLSLFSVFLGLLAFLIVSNLLISRKVWLPFKETLRTLNNYELGSTSPILLNKTSTQEFNQLNDIILAMTAKIKYDYINLKEFTENVAHEIQTPLAIIRRRCEKLLQQNDLNNDQTKSIMAIYNNCLRLSKVNKGLTLLTKIESGAYQVEKNVNLTQILISQIAHFQEMISLKNLTLNQEVKHEILHDINPELVVVLFSNFIKNAINHNNAGGHIEISTKAGEIGFYNTAKNGPINPELFQRFKKSESNSLGLGLSIITKICRLHNIKLSYEYVNDTHKFRLLF
ncbi:Signal transduction histidine kinase [Maribacter sedimenticola]|uniref:histidine kinase n=1 Tax=Maribacter sedimenticola TaxID=228956 RepID=A0ABY1SF62_9FLAO|nr:HAMP domain-containing sensor histidine kinase [Maribacter sedimenticola]SNR39567.1 Signal transduction histidine kinase [Maribacter sedimenticola]